jgi:hypothetical protein
MTYNLDFTTNVSRFAFIFLIYVLVTSGYISEILSCQMRNFIKDKWYVRHILAIILVFAFIMFEGGWDFDKSREDKESNNWAVGNTIHSLVIAILIYFIFLISSKSKLIPNILFFSSLFILYITNTYREYILVRGEINDSTNNNILFIEQIISIFAIIVFVFGFIQYYLYQKKEYKKDFSWLQFLVGTTNCTSGQKFSEMINTMTSAIKNINNENKDETNEAVTKMLKAISNNKDALELLQKISNTIKN